MTFAPGFWDLLLIGVVSLQVTAIAYLRAPRWKALVLCLPFPFTTIALGLDRPIDLTNLLGLVALFFYIQAIRLLHQRAGMPVAAAIPLAVLGYILFGWTAVRWLPAAPHGFWIGAALLFPLALFLLWRLPARVEPDHRTPLPVWLKLPIVVAVVCLLLLLKESLQGFATLFPMVAVVGAYEARHCLWTLGRQIPVLMLTMIPLMAVARLTQDAFGLPVALALGWCAFLAVLIPLTWRMWRPTRAATAGTP